MNLRVFAAILLLTLLPASPASGYLSGDPTIEPLTCPQAGCIHWGPSTVMSGAPLRLERIPSGLITISVCYYKELHCTTPSWCPTCPDYPTVRSIPLKEWCRRLEALPMPTPPLPTDKRPVCWPEWLVGQ